ncbi:MAG TPA: type IV toxin-antitoxin system AbiEi family antitoxin domain-containing protein [Bradyrhizobium sp.]|nr:type IV toxin-antitoxin system AbiEi family antitoxin domain-containing protein [Bradyrhizobium sp.]
MSAAKIHNLVKHLDLYNVLYHMDLMGKEPVRQQDKAAALLRKHGMMRLSEFHDYGITSAAISRMEERGLLNQLGRGLYQLPDAPLDTNHSLAVAAKLVPNGVICLISALAFHELTDRIPAFVWMAIGSRDWRPTITKPRIIIERFGPKVFDEGIKRHTIERVSVPIYSPAKTIVDLFESAWQHKRLQYKSPADFVLATQGMKEALRLRKATPAEIAKFAVAAGIWEKIVQPRLEALTVDA